MIFRNEVARIVIPIIFIILIIGASFYKKKIEPTLSGKKLMIVRTVVGIIYLIIVIWTLATIFF